MVSTFMVSRELIQSISMFGGVWGFNDFSLWYLILITVARSMVFLLISIYFLVERSKFQGSTLVLALIHGIY